MITHVVSAEWMKIRSVRSTYYIGGVVVLGVLFAVLVSAQAAALWDDLLPETRRGDYNMTIVQAITVPIVQLSLALLGVLAITSEYAKGTIRASFAAVPRRGLVLGGKALVIAAVAAVTGLASVSAAFYASGAIFAGLPVVPESTPPAGEQVSLLLAVGLSGAVFALVGLGLGAALRSTTGAVFALVAQWYVLPMLAPWLPEPWNDRVASVLLPNLAPQIVGEDAIGFGMSGVLSPMAAVGVAAAYILLTLGAAAAVVAKRDP